MYNRFARVLRRGFRLLKPGWRVDEANMIQGGAVYLIHHQNMFGPVHAIGLMPVEARMWSLRCFFDREECFNQFYSYTFRERYGWARPAAWLYARAASLVVPAVLRGFGCIPVYRGEGNLSTMRDSVKALCAGENIAICLDKDYASEDPLVGEVYSGFLMLGKLYLRQNGQRLPFVPVHIDARAKRLSFSPPLYVDETASFADVQRDMSREIVQAMNAPSASL